MIFLNGHSQCALSPSFGPKLFPHNLAQANDMGAERLVLAAPQHKVDLDVFVDLSGMVTAEKNARATDVLRSSHVPIAFPEFAVAHWQFDRKALGLPVLAAFDHPQFTIR